MIDNGTDNPLAALQHIEQFMDMNGMTTIERTAATNSEAPPSPVIIFEAIVKQQAVSAIYNRGEVVLAPHVIYTRHDELYVDAMTLEREGKPPKEEKMGTFKLAGLGALRVTPRRFVRSPIYVAGDPKYAGVTLMAI